MSLLRFIALDPKSPLQYASARQVYRQLKKLRPTTKVTLNQVNDFVERNVRARAILAKQPDRRFERLPYRTWGYGDQIQADLLFMHWSKKNVLTVIDLFSRQAEAEICADKSARNVVAAFKRILKRMRISPTNVQTDQGKEFDNSIFKGFMKDIGAHWFYVRSELKSVTVENWNKTLRAKFQTIKRQERQLAPSQILRRAVWQYNNTPHSALSGRTPASINYANAKDLLEARLAQREAKSVINRKNQSAFKFQVGDFVRATIEREATTGIRKKAADGTYTEEVFQVTQRLRKNNYEHINLYKVQDLTGEELEGLFYEQQLRKEVRYDPKRKEVKKVISKRKYDSVVSLLDHPSSHRAVLPNPKRFRRPPPEVYED